MAGRGRSPVDILVGRNIRIHRLNRGLSQTELGRHIGVTFQQVQKYENGANRVGSGRLFKIAGLLGVPVSVFFEGAHYSEDTAEVNTPVALLAEPYALRVLKAFCEIDDSELRRSLVEFTEKYAAKLRECTQRKPRREKRSSRSRSR
jgi:transcriptional regulator with XRE-family HTH domain